LTVLSWMCEEVESPSERVPSWWNYPVVNVFYQLLFKSSGVNVEHAVELLNLVGLLSALMLTVAVAIPLSASQSTYDDVLKRFGDNSTAYGSCETVGGPWADPWEIINRFNRHCTLGITFSSSATITSVLSILLASLSERETNTVHEIDAWWRWFKVIVLAAIIMAVLGTQQTLEAYRFWMIMTIPNEYVEKHGCEGFKATYGPDMSDVTNSWGYTFMCSVFLSNASLIITIVFSSLGSAASMCHCSRANKPLLLKLVDFLNQGCSQLISSWHCINLYMHWVRYACHKVCY